MTILFSIGFTVSLFSILLLARKENYSISEIIATAILGVWAVRFILFYLKGNVDLTPLPWLYFIDQCLFFLDGPLLYLYTKSLLHKGITKKALWNFVPALFASVVTICTYLQIPKDEWVDVIEQLSSQIEQNTYTVSIEESVFILSVLVHNIIYTIVSLKGLKKIRKMMLANLSTISNRGVQWLSKFIKFWILLLVLPLVIYFINYIFPIIAIQYLEMLLIISLVASAIYFGAKTIEQEHIDFYNNEDKQEVNVIEKEVSDSQLKIMQNLREFMERKQPFLEVDLSLSKLASLTNLKPNELSYLINNCTNGNFHDFVNEYRIENVKTQLKETNEQVILIAYSNGFNSKSTFNNVFKKNTGMTPTQYRKNLTRKN